MFFIFSKVLAFLLYPLLYVFVLLLVAIFSKSAKWRRRGLLYGVGLLYVVSNSFLLNQFAKAWDVPSAKLVQGKVYSTVIVLGGFASYDKNAKGMFNGNADRFIQGVLLQKSNRVKRILITGGNGNLNPGSFREGSWAKVQLRGMQVPDSCILIEDQSRNTLENASMTKELLQKNKLQGPYLIVTSAFHMRRSLGIFKKAGIDVIPYSCNYIAGTGNASFSDLVPNADIITKWSTYLKEVIGLTVNRISGRG